MSKRGYIYIYIYILVVICVLCGLGLAYSLGSVQRSATFSTITLDIERTLASNSAAKKADEFAGIDEFAAYARAQKFTHFTYTFTFVPSGKIFTHNRLYAMHAIALDPHIESITFARKGCGQFVAGSLLAPSVLQSLSEQGLIYTLSIQKKFYRAVAIGLLALLLIMLLLQEKVRAYLASITHIPTLFKPNDSVIYVCDYSLTQALRLRWDFPTIAFILYMAGLSALIASRAALCALVGDDWIYSSTYPVFYSPLDFTGVLQGWFWQRGRHIADVLMVASMRPFGEELVSFGVEVVAAFKIVAAFFSVCAYLLISCMASVLVYWINQRRDFRLIFVLVSLVVFVLFTLINFVNMAAYVWSAGVALAVFLPVGYYFVFGKEVHFSRNLPMHIAFVFVLSYCACFQNEPSTLAIAGMSFLLLLARGFRGHSATMWYYCVLLCAMPFITTLLTYVSGRGKWQQEIIQDTTTLGNIKSYLAELIASNHIALKWVLIASGVLLMVLAWQHIRKRLAPELALSASMLAVGLIGVVGFSAIRVNAVWFLLLLICCALIGLGLLWRHSRNGALALAGNFGIVVLIFTLLIASARVYEESFKKYYPAHNAPHNLIALFVEAQAKGQDEITLTSKDIAAYNLELQRLNTDPKGYPNEHISYFMRHYGYTKDIIYIRRVE